jgi:hypothetical protein
VIGVFARAGDEPVIHEFFELFKTPWEFFRSGRRYEVVLCNSENAGEQLTANADVVVFYAGRKTEFDSDCRIALSSQLKTAQLDFGGAILPIYGDAVLFQHEHRSVLTEHEAGRSAIHVHRRSGTTVIRVGYDLFREICTLLENGQPVSNAGCPALELHIDCLRQLIVGCGVQLVEVPPVPAGYKFATCLTHDLDHASIRRHKLDATAFGFLYRATAGSALKAARGRLSLSKLSKNWGAAAKLPLIHLGLAEDFWERFDRYLDFEKGRPSTFFVVPFAGRPGRSVRGPAPAHRATAYDVTHIDKRLRRVMSAGCEVGLHGIDAWADAEAGRLEASRISSLTKAADLGVRMHWLYRDENSPAKLEEAGFSYDSTVGYNETVGYRAGLMQVFKPLRASRLLELPMHIMDTALLYPSYLGLSEEKAFERIKRVIASAAKYGGALTVNWHDRSIAPERLWGELYRRLVDECTTQGAWFATGKQATSWFRKRRSVVFETSDSNDGVRAAVTQSSIEKLPALILRRWRERPGDPGSGRSQSYTDEVLESAGCRFSMQS